MKSVVFAGALAAALSLTALAQQRAAAQCCQRGGEVSFNVGLTLGLHWTPCQGHWVPNCNTCGYPGGPYGYPPMAYGYPPYGCPPGYAVRPTAAAQPLPGGPPVPPATPKGASADVQNIGYTYPSAYGYEAGYNYNYDYAAMSGYPYYEAPYYWYGR